MSRGRRLKFSAIVRGSGEEYTRLMPVSFLYAALLLNLSVCHKAKLCVVSYRIARRAASAASHTPRSISGVTWRISANVMILPPKIRAR